MELGKKPQKTHEFFLTGDLQQKDKKGIQGVLGLVRLWCRHLVCQYPERIQACGAKPDHVNNTLGFPDALLSE